MTIRQKKDLGQNFLADEELLSDFVETSQPEKPDNYLEIGTGLGSVTKVLSPRVSSITAVEFDRDLIPILKRNLKNLGNVLIVNADILRWLNDFCYHDLYHDRNFNKIIGSIPYQITSPLLHLIVQKELRERLDSIVLLIQKEVAEKIKSQPPKANYLSLFLQTFFDISYVKTIPKEIFTPVPKVDGAIIKLTKLKTEMMKIKTDDWSKFLHHGFQHPRQMLKKIFDERILKESGIDPTRRAGTLDLQDWAKLYESSTEEKV